MAFRIMPHGRLQEWVADENGYFADEGLDYVFVTGGETGGRGRDESGQIRSGAYESYEAGRDTGISCACHWAVSSAAANHIGKLVASAYSVTPAAIMVPPESGIRRPEDLAGVEVGVGFHSGSHFTTLQGLEAVLPPDQINLSFEGGPNDRLDGLLERRMSAATVFGVQLYIAEAFGFRKVLDTSFMIAFLVNEFDADPADVEKYFAGLRRAQMEIDLRPERYKHFHDRAVPEKYRDAVDVRTFGPGERIVFLPYEPETYRAPQAWIGAREIFAEPVATSTYDSVVLAPATP